MAPAVLTRTPSGEHIRQASQSISTILTSALHLSSRRSSTDPTQTPPLASIFALIIRGSLSVSKRAAEPLISRAPTHAHSPSLHPINISKRQSTVILAIPTTYQGLNAGPPPGTVVGITLGAIAGFILLLYIILTATRLYGGRETIVEEEVIRRHVSRSPSRRRSRSASQVMSEVRSPPRRRESRRETIIEEERVERRSSPDPVVEVEEEQDDIVEVIEEHSPERAPRRKESRRVSGYRTVDPSSFGGGGRPLRKVSRR